MNGNLSQKQQSGLAHCCHHDVHWEYCDSYEERINYIIEEKPKCEHQIRLKMFKLIPNSLLPGRRSALWRAYKEAWFARADALEAYNDDEKKVWRPWREAREDAKIAEKIAEKAQADADKAQEDAQQKRFWEFWKTWKAHKMEKHAQVLKDRAWEAKEYVKECQLKAQDMRDILGDAYERCDRTLDRCWAAYYKKYAKKLDALHDKLFPDCPWDGETILEKRR